MTKEIKLYLFASLILFAICLGSLGYFIAGLEEQEEAIKSLVGRRVILDKDTLLIIDYSILGNTYILSDGHELNTELATKLLMKE